MSSIVARSLARGSRPARLACVGLVAFATGCGTDAAPPQSDAAVVVVPDATDAAVADAPPARLNGCTRETAVDRTAADAMRVIVAEDNFFTPPCIVVAVGQSVTWQSDFEEHPLEPGIIRGPNIESQPGSPIGRTSTGAMVTFAMPEAGAWAFYCPAHPPEMAGVVYVE